MKIFFTLFWSFFACSLTFGQNDFDGANLNQKIPLAPSALHGVLDNGLTYYLLENKMPEGRAFLRLVVKAGSAMETEEEQGLAHFVEHMAFNGTERFPESALVDYMRSLGMRFGADLNAYTSFNETVYMLEVPCEINSDGKKTVPLKALEIFDDWTRAVLFNEKDVEEERSVILEEKRMRSGSGARLQEVYFPILFEGSPYANRLPIGKMEVVQNAPPSLLKSFYKKWYAPSSMAVIAVGDFDGEILLNTIKDVFKAPKPAKPPKIKPAPLPPPKKNKTAVHIWKDEEAASAQARILYKQKWRNQKNTVKNYRTHIIDNMASSIINRRLSNISINPSASFTYAGASLTRPVSAASFFAFSAQAKDGRLTDAVKALLAEKEAIIRYGFTESEIETAKTAMLSDFERFYAERSKMSSSAYVNEFTQHFLYDIEAPGIEWEYKAVNKLLPDISQKDINKRAASYFKYNDVLIFISAPLGEENLPAQEEIEFIAKNPGLLEVNQPQEYDVSEDLLDAGVIEKGEIVLETEHEGLILKGEGGVEKKIYASQTLDLSNGARVILQKTDNKDDDITLYAIAKGGSGSVKEEDSVSARLAAEIVSSSGLGKWSLSRLVKKLTGKQVSISWNVSAFMRSISGDSNNLNLETLFQLIYLYFTSFRLDEDAVVMVKDAWTVNLKSQNEDPETFFGNEIAKIMYGNNAHLRPLEISDLSLLDIEAARNFVKEAMNPKDWVFVFTGNIDYDKIKEFIKQYIASIPEREESVVPMNDYPKLNIQRPSGETHSLSKGKEEKSLVFLSRSVSRQFDLKTALAANMLGGCLDIILTSAIREKLGGVYSISVNCGLTPISYYKDGEEGSGELSLEVFFACAPERTEELKSAVEEALKNAASGGAETADWEKARLALIRGLEKSLQSNAYVSRGVGNFSLIFNLDISTFYTRDKIYSNIEIEEALEVLKSLLACEGVSVIMNPQER
ncbi:MAG: insulinase family protein [Spirochaetaceae bacterium]|jgi:zinc protease|nr:insulinase family protein [Spirochaetaceae bacterium]